MGISPIWGYVTRVSLKTETLGLKDHTARADLQDFSKDSSTKIHAVGPLGVINLLVTNFRFSCRRIADDRFATVLPGRKDANAKPSPCKFRTVQNCCYRHSGILVEGSMSLWA